MWKRRLRDQRIQEAIHSHAPRETHPDQQSNQQSVDSTSAEKAASVASSSLLEWIRVALPPTTLATALAFWFGYALTTARNSYLGIDVSTLGFTPTDYLLRSIDALILPAITLLVVWLSLLGVHTVVWPRILGHCGKKRVRYGLIALALLGVTALVLSLLLVSALGRILNDWRKVLPEAYLVPPLLLGMGSVCVAYGVKGLHARRRGSAFLSGNNGTPSHQDRIQGILLVLVLISLFWGTTLHAGALGRGRAIAFVDTLSTRPSVTVFSKTSLALPPPVIETPIGAPESEYRFRYTNLRLVIRSNEKYFLLPDGWSRSTGTAILLEDTSNIRLEFRPGEPLP